MPEELFFSQTALAASVTMLMFPGWRIFGARQSIMALKMRRFQTMIEGL
ncbi:MAG: hypothetical protein AB7E60_06000 [Sphingobium sp.]